MELDEALSLLRIDFKNLTKEQITAVLNVIGENVNIILDFEEIQSLIFHQFKLSDLENKQLIFEQIKGFSHRFSIINIDLIEMIESKNHKYRSLANKIIKQFWHIYEFDEVIVFLIRKQKTFKNLLRRNKKYSVVFRKILFPKIK